MTYAVEDAAPSGRLPSIGKFISGIFGLGADSLLPGLPGILVLWLGPMVAGNLVGISEGDGEKRPLLAYALGAAVSAGVAFFGALPFLPLQDSLRRGEKATFHGGVRKVLRRFGPVAKVGVAQAAISFGPAVVLSFAIAIMQKNGMSEEEMMPIGVAAFLPCVLWGFLSTIFFAFALPATVLSDRSPKEAIAISFRLGRRHFGGLLLRGLVFALLALMLAAVANIPAYIAGTSSALGLAWGGLVNALLTMLALAAGSLLYRSLVPFDDRGPSIASEGDRLSHPSPDPIE